MGLSVGYYCPCLTNKLSPPPSNLASSSYSFHSLHDLFFCEECDAIRCNRCVLVEVSGYYCTNCLFEVPSASVRAEKNRCARNCFMCPNCQNTLTVVPSDPPDNGDARSTPILINTVGEPPFFLYCNHCRWDSAEVGITFEKPTGLAAQLQKFEDSAPETLEFERLKEHFEPFLRASQSSSTQPNPSSHHTHINPITAAATSALARDIPGVGKYNPLTRSRSSRDGSNNNNTNDNDSTSNTTSNRHSSKHKHRNEIPDYRSRIDVGSGGGLVTGSGGDVDVEFMKHLESISEVGSLEQRWMSSWITSSHSSDLKPMRIPLHSKKSKRCPGCRHILIKPEQKAQSVRYKIKLVAANYIPSISISLPHALAAKEAIRRSTLSKSATNTAIAEENAAAAAGGMVAGKTYPFQLSIINPLYDPIQVRLHPQLVIPLESATTTTTTTANPLSPSTMNPSASPSKQGQGENKPGRPPSGIVVALPSHALPIAAFAEAWEYEDDEDMFVDEDGDDGVGGGKGGTIRGGKDRDGKGKTKTVGILEKRANVIVVGGEVTIGREARGTVRFNMLVTYVYHWDDPDPEGEEPTTASKRDKGLGTPAQAPATPKLKSFSFYNLVELGYIIPREEPKADTMDI